TPRRGTRFFRPRHGPRRPHSATAAPARRETPRIDSPPPPTPPSPVTPCAANANGDRHGLWNITASRGRAAELDDRRPFRDCHRRDAAVGYRASRLEREYAHPTRNIGATRCQGGALQVAQHVHLASRQRLRVHDPCGTSDRIDEVQALPARMGAIDDREQRFARATAQYTVAQHQPDPISGGGPRE